MMENGTTIIIIPTYNEVENIEKLLRDVGSINAHIDVLVIDDNSPDGTANAVKKVMALNKNVHLIERERKMGLGTAYVTGFKFALDRKYQYIFEMDADYSHDPKEISNFLKAIQDADLVIGSRYIKGVNVVNWPLQRLLLSYFANKYTRFVTGLPICDSTGGFKCFRRETLEAINLDKLRSGGYSFQIEVNYQIWKKGFRIKEIPIIFIDRALGKSKMSKKIVREAMWMVWKLRLISIFGFLKQR
jgi:dolichol-phosphate mannosyltransferase